MCFQLLSNKYDKEVERNESPDGGIEFFILRNGSLYGYQCKFIFRLQNTQWTQINRSVKTALENNKNLVEYVVCVPINLNAKTQRRSWKAYTEKWNILAKKKKMKVKFTLYDQSHILQDLTRPESVGIRNLFFQEDVFEISWLKNDIEVKSKDAGPRYSPELNIEHPISKSLESIGRTPYFFDKIILHITDIIEKWDETNKVHSIQDNEVSEVIKRFESYIHYFLKLKEHDSFIRLDLDTFKSHLQKLAEVRILNHRQ